MSVHLKLVNGYSRLNAEKKHVTGRIATHGKLDGSLCPPRTQPKNFDDVVDVAA